MKISLLSTSQERPIYPCIFKKFAHFGPALVIVALFPQAAVSFFELPLATLSGKAHLCK
jgi:hypothetical protein